jgi:hypothetical protein
MCLVTGNKRASKLCDEIEEVGTAALLNESSAFDMHDIKDGDRYLPSGWCDPAKDAIVGAHMVARKT